MKPWTLRPILLVLLLIAIPERPEAQVKTVPHMPDQDYKWLSDEAWRIRNDAHFARP